ncbi:MAG: hypothetical protein IPH76_03505 [Xanthomonadales bacterium]|nr:hypothetical protein [Xanthomonadales bacterium]
MKFETITSRLTGISCPIFGVSWNPPESARAVAARLIAFLEDRRVLYNAGELESPDHCAQSVIQIRHFLTGEIGKLDSADPLNAPLRAMRSACRKFLDVTHAEEHRRVHPFHRGDYAGWVFTSGLGEMRGVFGLHLAQLAAQYGLDVEDDLAVILPAGDAPDEASRTRNQD